MVICFDVSTYGRPIPGAVPMVDDVGAAEADEALPEADASVTAKTNGAKGKGVLAFALLLHFVRKHVVRSEWHFVCLQHSC